MKALFGRNRKNEYPDHHYPDPAAPYYPSGNHHPNDDSIFELSSINKRSAQSYRVPARAAQTGLTTLEALQIIRRRFEESQKATYEEQAA